MLTAPKGQKWRSRRRVVQRARIVGLEHPGSLVVASLALVSNVIIAAWGNAKTNRKLGELEKSMATGLEKLDGKVNDVEGTTRYLTGYLDGSRRRKGAMMMKAGYEPGKQIKKVVDEVEPSRASGEAFERGFYEGEYDVVAVPRIPLRHELELIRQAAQTKWPNVLVVSIVLRIGSARVPSTPSRASN